MDEGNETLRWPTDLDRDAIIERLVRVREQAAAAGLAELAERFAGVETMDSPRIGAAVVSALSSLLDKPQERAIATQLEMVAVNLKNLR